MASAAYKKGQESSIVEKDGPNSIEGKNKLMKLQKRLPELLSTANVLTIKTRGTGNCGVPVGKISTIYGKGCKNHKEPLCMLWINPVIFTDCGETP